MIFKAVGLDRSAGAGEVQALGEPTGFVVIEVRDVGELIGVVGESARGVKELLDTVIGPLSGEQAARQVERLLESHSVCGDAVGGPVLVVVDGLEYLAEGVA